MGLSTSLTTKLTPPVSGRLTGVKPVPQALGAAGWLTADDQWLTRSGTDLVTMTNRINGSGVFTAFNTPQYNATGNFASGAPSITLTRTSSEYLQETTGTLLTIGDNFDRHTVYSIIRHNTVGAGANTVWSSGTSDDRVRNYLDTGIHRSFRDAGAGGTITSGDTLLASTDYWQMGGYSGRDVQLQVKGGSLNTGFNNRDVGTATDLLIGEQTSGGGHGDFEMMDWVIFDRWLNAADHATMQAWADQRIALGTHLTAADRTQDAFYTVGMGQSNMVQMYRWGYEEFGNVAINGSGTDEWYQGSTYYDALEADILTNCPADRPLCIYVSNGEDEAQTAPRAALYLSEMQAIIAALESDLPNHTFTWVFELLHASGTRSETATVRAAQETLIAADANAYSSDHDDLTLSDGVHYQDSDLNTRRARLDAVRAANI